MSYGWGGVAQGAMRSYFARAPVPGRSGAGAPVPGRSRAGAARTAAAPAALAPAFSDESHAASVCVPAFRSSKRRFHRFCTHSECIPSRPRAFCFRRLHAACNLRLNCYTRGRGESRTSPARPPTRVPSLEASSLLPSALACSCCRRPARQPCSSTCRPCDKGCAHWPEWSRQRRRRPSLTACWTPQRNLAPGSERRAARGAAPQS